MQKEAEMKDFFTIEPSPSGFNVFDEWGHFKGNFTPTGSGENGCLMLITFALVGVIGFCIYLVYRMTVEGLRSLFRGEWIKAIVLFAPVWLFLGIILVGMFSMALKSLESSQGLQNITIENVTSLNCEYSKGWIRYDVVNNWNRPVQVWAPLSLYSNPCGSNGTTVDFPNRGWNLKAGQRVSVYSYYDPDACAVSVELSKNNYINLCPKP